MAKAKNQQSTAPSTTSPTCVPSTDVPPIADNDSISTSVKPDLTIAADKTDASSSHNISISSINEDDPNDSSTFESSDSECDDEQIKKAIDRIPRSLQPGGQLIQNGMMVVKDDGDPPPLSRGPNIGSIAVQNSSDITFGNKTYIKGQVVIKNIYHDAQNGATNLGYNETDGELAKTKEKSGSPAAPSIPQSWKSSLKPIFKEKPSLIAIIVVVLLLVFAAIAIITYVATSADKDFLPDAKPLRIVTRNEWLAQPPSAELDPLKLPVHKVIIAHTATEGCKTQTACAYRTRFIQEKHINVDNYGDIGYNFLIGGDGQAYEGRGWLKMGAFLRGQNHVSEGIAFIGDYRRVQPNQTQMDALNQLLDVGVRKGHITPDYKLYGALQWQATESPGTLLYEEIKKHPHYGDDMQ